jgi:hypothetical protein
MQESRTRAGQEQDKYRKKVEEISDLRLNDREKLIDLKEDSVAKRKYKKTLKNAGNK